MERREIQRQSLEDNWPLRKSQKETEEWLGRREEHRKVWCLRIPGGSVSRNRKWLVKRNVAKNQTGTD